jgi:hypothetical protein
MTPSETSSEKKLLFLNSRYLYIAVHKTPYHYDS